MESVYKDEQKRIKKPNERWNRYSIPRVESDKEILQTKIGECDALIGTLKGFLSHPVFAYDFSRQKTIFNVSPSEFSRTGDYLFLYRSICEYEKTSFYWSGDNSTLYRLPAFRFSEEGKDYWVRKYSMMYEYWCYLRIHETISNLGYLSSDRPDVNQMQRSVFQKGNSRIILFHDVDARKKNIKDRFRNSSLLIPHTGNKTPDFALIFENLTTRKVALIILDSKSDAWRLNDQGLSTTFDKYIRADIGKKRAADLVFRQCWIVYSGENEEKKMLHPFIETPPSMSPNEFSQFPDVVIDGAGYLAWRNDSFHLRLSELDDHDETPTFIGCLRSHVKTTDDSYSPDHFREFLAGQIELMEQCLK